MTWLAINISSKLVDGQHPKQAGPFLCKLNSSDSVANRVQGRRPHSDAHDIWDDEDEGAGHAGLGWQADLKGELPGVVVHAAAEHQG